MQGRHAHRPPLSRPRSSRRPPTKYRALASCGPVLDARRSHFPTPERVLPLFSHLGPACEPAGSAGQGKFPTRFPARYAAPTMRIDYIAVLAIATNATARVQSAYPHETDHARPWPSNARQDAQALAGLHVSDPGSGNAHDHRIKAPRAHRATVGVSSCNRHIRFDGHLPLRAGELHSFRRPHLRQMACRSSSVRTGQSPSRSGFRTPCSGADRSTARRFESAARCDNCAL